MSKPVPNRGSWFSALPCSELLGRAHIPSTSCLGDGIISYYYCQRMATSYALFWFLCWRGCCLQTVLMGSWNIEASARGQTSCHRQLGALGCLLSLLVILGEDTETFLVLCSPAILTRKWCVGEMVTARANKVSTLLLAWGDFSLPDEPWLQGGLGCIPTK